MCDLCSDRTTGFSRRQALIGAGAVLATVALGAPPLGAEQANPAGAANAIAPAEALERLMQGNARYAAGECECKDYSVGRAERAETQHPIAAILSCSDSRVSPELLFDQNPGDIFVVRLAGNFLDDDGLASLEYAVKFLGAPLVMVLGHTNCGAIATAVKVVKERIELPGNLPELIRSIEPAVIAAHGKHPSDLVAQATEENVRINMKRLIDDAPIMTDALSAKQIAVSGGIYEIASGTVRLL